MSSNFFKTLIRKGDQVAVIRGEGRTTLVETGKDAVEKQVFATVDRIDRRRGKVFLRTPLERAQDSMGRQKPLRGIEVYKNIKFNPQTNEPGGTRVVPRGIQLSCVQLRCPKCGRVGVMKAERKAGVMEQGTVRNGLIIKRVCKGSSKKPGCGNVF